MVCVCVCVTGTGSLNPSYCLQKLIPNNTDGTNKNTTTQHKLSLITAHSREASEQRINHCMRGKRIKRHKRNETERKARINTHTHKRSSKSACMCVFTVEGPVWWNKAAAIQQPQTQQWVILAVVSIKQALVGIPGKLAHTHTHTHSHTSCVTVTITEPVCERDCNQRSSRST